MTIYRDDKVKFWINTSNEKFNLNSIPNIKNTFCSSSYYCVIIITLYYEIFVAHQMSCGLIKFIFVVVAVVIVAVFVVVCIITIQSNLNVQMFQCLFSSIFL